MMRILMVSVVVTVVAVVAGGSFLAQGGQAAPAMKMREVTYLNLELEGSKVWLPGVLVLKRGEEVKLKLVNKHKDPHGLAVDELKLRAVVEGASTNEVVLKPSRTGTFRLYCHLHPAHIGGAIVVNP